MDVPTPKEEKRKLLGMLIDLIKSGNTEPIKQNFK